MTVVCHGKEPDNIERKNLKDIYNEYAGENDVKPYYKCPTTKPEDGTEKPETVEKKPEDVKTEKEPDGATKMFSKKNITEDKEMLSALFVPNTPEYVAISRNDLEDEQTVLLLSGAEYFYPALKISTYDTASKSATPIYPTPNSRYKFTKGTTYLFQIITKNEPANAPPDWKAKNTDGDFYLLIGSTLKPLEEYVKDEVFKFDYTASDKKTKYSTKATVKNGEAITTLVGGKDMKVGVFDFRYTPYLNKDKQSIMFYAPEGDTEHCKTKRITTFTVVNGTGENAGNEPKPCIYQATCYSTKFDEIFKAIQ